MSGFLCAIPTAWTLDSATGSKCLKHLGQHGLILFYVFQHVEGSDDVKLVYIGYLAGVHLQKTCLCDPFGRKG